MRKISRKKIKLTEKSIEKLSAHLEKLKIHEYLELLENKKKLIWVNVIAGTARGIGFTFGVAAFAIIVGAVLVLILSLLGYLPFAGEFFRALNKDVMNFMLEYVGKHK